MKCATIVNILGITLEIVGVAILSRFELKAHILAEAENLVRPTVFAEMYQAATQAKEYEPSTQEQEVQARGSVPALRTYPSRPVARQVMMPQVRCTKAR